MIAVAINLRYSDKNNRDGAESGAFIEAQQDSAFILCSEDRAPGCRVVLMEKLCLSY